MSKSRLQRRAAHVAVTPEERYHLINDVAYFRAVKQRQEAGANQDSAAYWCEVEAEIDTILHERHAK